MCGFFITNVPSLPNNIDDILEESLRFRGPDCSSGLVENNGWKAYHSRLSIIDLSVGNNQPKIDSEGGMLVFNGEILNYKDLGLKYFDREFHSDTDVLSKLLLNNKLKLNELDGFYSFVYINKAGELVHAVRDPFGVKPLFYHQDNNGISFCSEPSVLNKIFDCGTNLEAIEEYYATRAPIFSGSYFKDIVSVFPGHCYVSGCHFDAASYLTSYYNSNSSINEVKKALKKGITTRLVSDAPVGLLLSRGVDSNLLRHMGDFDKYYTIGFKGDEDIEYLKGQNIYGLTAIHCSPEEYKKAFEYLLELRGEPMSVPNEVLLYIISTKAADDGVKVLLSGEGADEFFGGYDRIFKWAQNATNFDLDGFLHMYCYLAPKKDSNLYLKFKTLFDSQNFESTFEAVRWFFIRYHMPILFRRLDFSLMAAGVEGREPIANMHTFLEAIKFTSEELMGEKLGKTPLRELISEYMGKGFAYESKVGFPVDLTKVFENKQGLSSYELWFKENLKVLK